MPSPASGLIHRNYVNDPPGQLNPGRFSHPAIQPSANPLYFPHGKSHRSRKQTSKTKEKGYIPICIHHHFLSPDHGAGWDNLHPRHELRQGIHQQGRSMGCSGQYIALCSLRLNADPLRTPYPLYWSTLWPMVGIADRRHRQYPGSFCGVLPGHPYWNSDKFRGTKEKASLWIRKIKGGVTFVPDRCPDDPGVRTQGRQYGGWNIPCTSLDLPMDYSRSDLRWCGSICIWRKRYRPACQH
jgi:hypothetical protein